MCGSLEMKPSMFSKPSIGLPNIPALTLLLRSWSGYVETPSKARGLMGYWESTIKPLIRWRIDLGEELAIDQIADDVSEQDMRFLDARRLLAWHAEKDFATIFHLPARLSGQPDSKQSLCPRHVDRFEHARRIPARRNRDRCVAGLAEGLDLAGENLVVSVIVSTGRQNRCICRQRNAGER